ncbi:hypothetical protein CEXT_39071 [Caerostris extrusa]|uniref:Uncharacterized protein n=1 Tax=Caerostris extrusa TaxID=172846 RepID=A0AAV4TJS5_CAEEX|nr:hypothetical protein CEXT_39071 [Caerostris extrusa]
MSVCAPFHSAGACKARGVALQTSRVELAESAKTHGGVTWRNPFPKKRKGRFSKGWGLLRCLFSFREGGLGRGEVLLCRMGRKQFPEYRVIHHYPISGLVLIILYLIWSSLSYIWSGHHYPISGLVIIILYLVWSSLSYIWSGHHYPISGLVLIILYLVWSSLPYIWSGHHYPISGLVIIILYLVWSSLSLYLVWSSLSYTWSGHHYLISGLVWSSLSYI